MTATGLAAALRACATETYAAEAGIVLLIEHDVFLCRADFTDRFIWTGTGIADGTRLAQIDWIAAVQALIAGELPCSGGDRRMLMLSASLAAGIPVDLSDAIIGLYADNIQRLLTAIRRASGQPGAWGR